MIKTIQQRCRESKKAYLPGIVSIPDIRRSRIRRSGIIRLNTIAQPPRADTIAQDCHTCTIGDIEQQIKRLSLLGGGKVLDVVGATEGLGEPEPVHFLVCCFDVDGDGNSGHGEHMWEERKECVECEP